ncbi:MAG: M3 family oligoendopeptidase [Candidatus Eisenbacteria bacterium]|uniref:M3 family oligoendopeptidase n=1 Tax=Eiseniibacteriota bacterium TaxID=2212470 RepID=A0A937X9J3_UNCEI|nr:M3 family oligoendopeptidase [Candidatus Eisenbacteria bacterium]
MTTAATEQLPRWDLTNVYSGLEADDFMAAFRQAQSELAGLEAFVQEHAVGRLDAPPDDAAPAAAILEELLGRLNALLRLYGTLEAYVYAFVTTDSYNQLAARRMSEIEQLELRLKKVRVRLEAWVGSLAPVLERVCERSPAAREHQAVLAEMADQSRYLMPPPLEDLAAELQLSGGGVMWKLQGNVTSKLKAPMERDGRTQMLPMTVIRNLATDPDEGVRRRAYEAELQAWAAAAEPVAFALNGVKGAAIALARWRGRDGVLHAALDHSRIDRPTLEALLESMRDSFPVFRRYLQAKAGRLGKARLPWWDLFAPVGRVQPTYRWEEATEYIVRQFATFDGELADFAREAFAGRWIDAEPRDGKRGGAFCMGVPGVEQSRILANFDGSFDQMVTLAHELGHGFHGRCQRGLPLLRRGSPMPLAETASIFCETIVFQAALSEAPPEARVFILENQLMGACQVVVDIYSRYLFESELVGRRAGAELSVEELCAMMLDAQRRSYGEGLDPEHLHPYMWVLKPHYYYPDLHFYNYPYAFGLLFGLGVYAIYQREGAAFVPRYKALLRGTGEGKAAELAARFGIDIRSREFWDASLAVVAGQVEQYCALED